MMWCSREIRGVIKMDRRTSGSMRLLQGCQCCEYFQYVVGSTGIDKLPLDSENTHPDDCHWDPAIESLSCRDKLARMIMSDKACFAVIASSLGRAMLISRKDIREGKLDLLHTEFTKSNRALLR